MGNKMISFIRLKGSWVLGFHDVVQYLTTKGII
jgi:hypothetical protein